MTRVALPIGVNSIESVNMYILADGDKVTVVDCGVWRPDLPDGGLATMEAGLQGAGYALADVSRVIVTHAHIDHYGLAGRVMELTGADLSMHAMTDLDCEKYRHPDTARARRRDTYADHGIPEDDAANQAEQLTRWMPYLHSVVEASTRLRGTRRSISAATAGTSSTPRDIRSATSACGPRGGGLLLSGDHLLPGITPPVTFERGFDADPMRSYLRLAATGPATAARSWSIPATAGRSATRSAGSRRSCATRCGGCSGSGAAIQEGPCTVGR